MFKNKLPSGEEVTEGWRKLHSQGLLNFYSSNIITVIKSREEMGRKSSMRGRYAK
jgi:hypothetical protein